MPRDQEVPSAIDHLAELDVIEERRVADLVADRLAAAIEEGGLQPGDRLPTELQLGQRLGVGRTSVREGLQKLKAHGIVETRKGLGTFVVRSERQDAFGFERWSAEHRFALADLLELRMSLEATTSALAAQRGTDAELAALEARHLDHGAAGRSGSLSDVVRSDELFHRQLGVSAHNLALRRILEGLNSDSEEFRRRTHARPGGPKESFCGHAEILKAVRAHNEAAAREAMIAHLWHLYVEVNRAATMAEGTQGRRPLATRQAFF